MTLSEMMTENTPLIPSGINPRKNRQLTDKKIGASLRQLRQAAGLSQMELCKILGLQQAALSRVETGRQSLFPSQLVYACEYFGVDFTSFVSGKFNPWKVAQKFGQEDFIPERYRADMNSRVREIHPLLRFLLSTVGEDSVYDALDELGLKGLFFLAPEEWVSTYCLADLYSMASQNRWIGKGSLKAIAEKYVAPESHGVMLEIYQAQKNPIQLVEAYAINREYYERNYSYSVIRANEKTLELNVKAEPHMVRIQQNTPELAEFLGQLRSQVFSLLPRLARAKPLSVRQTQCENEGAHSCHYVIGLSAS